jgi:hypothetical protein
VTESDKATGLRDTQLELLSLAYDHSLGAKEEFEFIQGFLCRLASKREASNRNFVALLFRLDQALLHLDSARNWIITVSAIKKEYEQNWRGKTSECGASCPCGSKFQGTNDELQSWLERHQDCGADSEEE